MTRQEHEVATLRDALAKVELLRARAADLRAFCLQDRDEERSADFRAIAVDMQADADRHAAEVEAGEPAAVVSRRIDQSLERAVSRFEQYLADRHGPERVEHWRAWLLEHFGVER